MKLAYVADGRSPIARNWLGAFIEAGHEVHLISTTPVEPLPGLAGFTMVSVAYSGLAKPLQPGVRKNKRGLVSGAAAMNLRARARRWIGPYLLNQSAGQIRRIIEDIQPELVHAMRIPFEGMAAARAGFSQPLVVSVWGNDFTLHARATPGMARRTRETMARTSGLHADCRRDLKLAKQWGWPEGRPEIVLPGNGGIRPEIFHPRSEDEPLSQRLASVFSELPEDAKLVVNPRGFRGYVRNDTFFRSIPLIREQEPDALFLCPAMAGEQPALQWLDRLGIHGAVRLLPRLEPEEMAQLFSRAAVAVSPSEHDGTPNTLLESMACGAFPVAGDLDSIREWITDGENGLLIDPGDPDQLAEAVLRVLRDADLRANAAALNQDEISERASQPDVQRRAAMFYEQLIQHSHVE